MPNIIRTYVGVNFLLLIINIDNIIVVIKIKRTRNKNENEIETFKRVLRRFVSRLPTHFVMTGHIYSTIIYLFYLNFLSTYKLVSQTSRIKNSMELLYGQIMS